MKTIALALVAATMAAACTDLSEPWELDHPRLLAVRLSAPGLAAGEVAEVTVLRVDDAGMPVEDEPSLVSAAELNPAPVAAAVELDGGADGWTVTASDADAIARARAEKMLADDEPLDIQLGMTVSVAGLTDPLVALKTVRLGAALTNPATPTLRVDGVTVAAGGQATIPREREIELTFVETFDDPSEEEPMEFRWLTGTGELTKSQTRRGLLTVGPDDPDRGYIAAVVRAPDGGVSWNWIEVVVQ